MIKMSIPEMRMLRWMCGKSRNDRIRNANIHDMVKVVLGMIELGMLTFMIW